MKLIQLLEMTAWGYNPNFSFQVLDEIKLRMTPMYALNALGTKKLNARDIKIAEKTILKDEATVHMYIHKVLKSKFPRGEKLIAKNPLYALEYARDILGEAFPLGEKAISKNGYFAYLYAMEVLKSKFPAGEKTIINSQFKDKYLKFIESLK